MATTGHENESINVGGLKTTLQKFKTDFVDNSVNTRIENAIKALDSTKSQTAGTDGLSLSITETDGKITSISGSIASGTYDSAGAANTAKIDIIDSATSNGNTLKKLEDRVSPLETAIGSGGSIDTRIETAINALDSSASQTAGTDGLALSITETDGKITAISGSISSNTYAPASDSARITSLEADVSIGGSIDTRINSAVGTETLRAQNAESNLQSLYTALTQSDIIVGSLPASGTKNLIYRVPGSSSYSDYMWNGSSWVLMATYNNAIDENASQGSSNLITSGGVYKIKSNGSICINCDVSSIVKNGDNFIVSINGSTFLLNTNGRYRVLRDLTITVPDNSVVLLSTTENTYTSFSENVISGSTPVYLVYKNILNAGAVYNQNDVIFATSSPAYYCCDVRLLANLTPSKSILNGKKIGFLGDSITQQARYINYFTTLTGCNPVNYGVSGDLISKINASDTKCFEARYSNMANDCDMIVVLGGINDFMVSDIPFGGLADGASAQYTFYAGLHRLFNGLKNKYPNKPIVIMTPMHSTGYDGVDPEFTVNSDNTLSFRTNPTSSKTLKEYVNAIKDVAQFYSLPVIDLYSYSNINPINSLDGYFSGVDNLHPGVEGGHKMARTMLPIMEDIYRMYYS